MRATVAGVGIAVVLAGCGGSGRDFTLADAGRMGSVRPASPGWKWPAAPSHKNDSTAESIPGRSPDPLVRRLVDRLAPLSDLGDNENDWQDDDKLAHVDIGVYGDADDAHDALVALHDFAHAFSARSGRVTKDAPVSGLGDEAFVLWVGGKNGAQVTYHWRRRNLVLEAHMHCFGNCPPDVDTAARTWAEAVDARG
jgi:hypothetical protein